MINRNWQEYDQTERLLSMAVGRYAAMIGTERSMSVPDQGKIDDWLQKHAAAADLLDDLDLFEPRRFQRSFPNSKKSGDGLRCLAIT